MYRKVVKMLRKILPPRMYKVLKKSSNKIVDDLKKVIKKVIPQKYCTLLRRIVVEGRIKPKTINEAQQIVRTLKKNQFEGKRCFIVGGGPSLQNMDLTPLNDEYTMVVNRGFMLDKLGLKKSTFFGLSDFNAMREYGEDIPKEYYDYFCSFGAVDVFDIHKNISSFHMYTKFRPEKAMYNGFFQFDLDKKPVAHAYTVVLFMLQLAVWLGFKEIYFLGVDNNFKKVENMHWYKDSSRERDSMDSWQFDPEESNAKAFECAYKILKKKGVNIYNATDGGNLNEIPRVDFKKMMSKDC